jgi:hypothetical protein
MDNMPIVSCENKSVFLNHGFAKSTFANKSNTMTCVSFENNTNLSMVRRDDSLHVPLDIHHTLDH